jgi:hypothetical protein
VGASGARGFFVRYRAIDDSKSDARPRGKRRKRDQARVPAAFFRGSEMLRRTFCKGIRDAESRVGAKVTEVLGVRHDRERGFKF